MKKRKIEHTIKFKTSGYRKDRRTGVLSPVTRSRYAELLFKEGAGFNGRSDHDKTNRED